MKCTGMSLVVWFCMRWQRVADSRRQFTARIIQPGDVPRYSMHVVRIEVCLLVAELLRLTRVDDGHTEARCESGFEVGTIIVVGEVRDYEACGPNGGTDLIVDQAGGRCFV